MSAVNRQMTEEKRARIAELWNLNWTSSHIADAVGLSRNAVIGAVHRLRQKGVIMASREDKKPVRVAKKSHELPIRKNIKKIVNFGEPVGILGLTFQSCRYVVKQGSPEETRYCNNKMDRGSYCKEHYKLCYVPAKKSWS